MVGWDDRNIRNDESIKSLQVWTYGQYLKGDSFVKGSNDNHFTCRYFGCVTQSTIDTGYMVGSTVGQTTRHSLSQGLRSEHWTNESDEVNTIVNTIRSRKFFVHSCNLLNMFLT